MPRRSQREGESIKLYEWVEYQQRRIISVNASVGESLGYYFCWSDHRIERTDNKHRNKQEVPRVREARHHLQVIRLCSLVLSPQRWKEHTFEVRGEFRRRFSLSRWGHQEKHFRCCNDNVAELAMSSDASLSFMNMCSHCQNKKWTLWVVAFCSLLFAIDESYLWKMVSLGDSLISVISYSLCLAIAVLQNIFKSFEVHHEWGRSGIFGRSLLLMFLPVHKKESFYLINAKK